MTRPFVIIGDTHRPVVDYPIGARFVHPNHSDRQLRDFATVTNDREMLAELERRASEPVEYTASEMRTAFFLGGIVVAIFVLIGAFVWSAVFP